MGAGLKHIAAGLCGAVGVKQLRLCQRALIRPPGTFSHFAVLNGRRGSSAIPFSRPEDGRRWRGAPDEGSSRDFARFVIFAYQMW